METLIETKQVDLEPAKRCPDFDDDCDQVKDPAKCWAGNETLPTACGYCPLMFK